MKPRDIVQAAVAPYGWSVSCRQVGIMFIVTAPLHPSKHGRFKETCLGRGPTPRYAWEAAASMISRHGVHLIRSNAGYTEE